MNSPDYKGTVVRYLLYHKLNEVPLPKEFPQPLPKESNEPLNNMPRGILRVFFNKRATVQQAPKANTRRRTAK